MQFSIAIAHLRPLTTSSCRQWRAVVVVAMVGLMLPGDADAKAGYKVTRGGIELILPVEKKAGYGISVSANDQQRVKFKVEGPYSTIEYTTKGSVSSRRIKADFGAFGGVDVRLDFVRFASDPPRRGRCRGRGLHYREGIYRGTIELSPQEGVPEVSINRGRFYFDRRFRQVCKRRRPEYKPGGSLKRATEEGILEVSGKGQGRTVHFGATIFALRRNPARSGGVVGAAVHERREEVRVTRWMGSFFDGSFVMSRRGKRPETIEVKLPKPFTGRALYSRSPGSPPSWTGDLSIDLPGADGIPLAGPGFSAVLCRGRVDSCLYGHN